MLSQSQRAAFAQRLRRGRAEVMAIPRRPTVTDELPLSFGQEELWFIDQFAPGQAAYNAAAAIRLCGPLSVSALERAMDALRARHEALRTRLVTVEGRPVQVIDAPAPVGLSMTDLSGLTAERWDAELMRLAKEQAAQPFMLARDPLLRARLVRRAPEEHVLLLCVHHAVFDGWSSGVLIRDLSELYAAQVAGCPPDLSGLPVQYADFALWERDRLRGSLLAELAGYWRQALAGAATVQLPTDRPRPLLQSFHGGAQSATLPSAVLADLRALSQGHGTTLFVTLLAAVQVLLHRYTGQDDIVVGTVSACRDRPELAPLIGYLVNTLVIRTDMSGDPAFSELLQRTRTATVQAYAHRDLPFGKLVEIVRADRDPSRVPLAQVAVTLVDVAQDRVRRAGVDFELSDGYGDPDTAKSDLAFFAQVHGDQLTLTVQYATALFDDATVRRMLGNLRVLLEGVAADPSRRLSRLPLLTQTEVHAETVGWNGIAARYPAVCMHELFERQAGQAAAAVATELDGVTVSYAQLNVQANQVARWLRELGIGPEVLVGVGMARSLRRLAVLLGILKAGGGYVPLDPALPADRLSFMVNDARIRLIVTDDATERQLPVTDAVMLSADREWPVISAMNGLNPGFAIRPSNLAYVIYTSGSTGLPKGVAVEHRTAVNFLIGMAEHWQLGPADRVLQFASPNFDVSVAEIFLPLLSGGTTVLCPQEALLSPPRLAELMRAARVTFACLPPAVLSLLAGEKLPGLRVLMSAGEELSSELVRRWLRPGLRFANGYGPTEATMGATLMELDGTVSPPPIGRPMPNYHACLLDAHLNPVPVGVTGELHLGGPTLARGYLHQPGLTAQRFIPDPFSSVPGARLYKTGDLVRRRPDGTIQFLGRADGQVKIRGIRAELGEIEAALSGHPAVAQAVAMVREDTPGHRRLVGYARSRPGVPVAEPAGLREHLAGRLPGYMVPDHIVVLDAFPLTVNNKVDRAALPAPDTAAGPTAHTAPRTPVEAALTGMYAGLLGRDRVGIDDSFFELGGNSLQAMRLVTRLHSELATSAGVTDIFVAPTPRLLAARIGVVGVTKQAESGLVVELSAGPGIRPLFVISPASGTVFCYALLALELAGAFKVHGVTVSAATDGSPAASLDEVIARCATAIRATQAAGPYRLAGWSWGGIVAYEIARKLEQTGEDVMLALLDAPPSLDDRPMSEAERTALFVADACAALAVEPADLPSPAVAGTDDQLTWLAHRLGGDDADTSALRAQLARSHAVYQTNIALTAGYRPQAPVHADTLLVSAERSPGTAAGWLPFLTGTVRRIGLPGDHYAVLRPGAGHEVAAAIQAAWKIGELADDRETDDH